MLHRKTSFFKCQSALGIGHESQSARWRIKTVTLRSVRHVADSDLAEQSQITRVIKYGWSRHASLKALSQPFAQAQELSRVHNPVCIDAKHQHSGPQNLKSFINI